MWRVDRSAMAMRCSNEKGNSENLVIDDPQRVAGWAESESSFSGGEEWGERRMKAGVMTAILFCARSGFLNNIN
jgi:hypothetical protein